MRKPLITLCTFLMTGAIPAMAQEESKDPQIALRLPTQKGSFMLGANFMYGGVELARNYGNRSYVSSYDVGLSSRAGYFIKDNLMIGAEISTGFMGYSMQGYPFNEHIKNVGAGVFARKYFGSATEKDGSLRRLRFFVEAGVNYQRSWYSYQERLDANDYHWAMSQTSVSIMPGFNYFITNNIALEAGLRYTHTLPINCEVPDQLKAHVGIVWYLGGKK